MSDKLRVMNRPIKGYLKWLAIVLNILAALGVVFVGAITIYLFSIFQSTMSLMGGVLTALIILVPLFSHILLMAFAARRPRLYLLPATLLLIIADAAIFYFLGYRA